MPDGSEATLIVNDPETACDAAMDIQDPFHPASAAYPREKRVFATTEPSGLTPEHDTNKLADYYGLILSWHPRLRTMPQTKVWHPCGKWATPCSKDDKKEFGIGGFISHKQTPPLDGYLLRMEILRRQHEIENLHGTVYNFQKSWRGVEHDYPVEGKDRAMKWMFHLSIENQREDGWFTEKLMDPIAARTVPLYYGAPDIGDIFDVRGFILLRPETAIEQINALKPEDYESRIEYMDKNFEISKQFWSLDQQMAFNCWKGLH